MKLTWSDIALADLERFADFLHDKHPAMASRIASEIVKRGRLIADHPQLGRRGPGVSFFNLHVAMRLWLHRRESTER